MDLTREIADLYSTLVWLRIRKQFITSTFWVWVQFKAWGQVVWLVNYKFSPLIYWLFSVLTDLKDTLSVPPVLQHKMFFRYFVTNWCWKKAWPFVWTNLNPLHQGCFVPNLVDIGPLDLKKMIKMFKVYDDDNKNNN